MIQRVHIQSLMVSILGITLGFPLLVQAQSPDLETEAQSPTSPIATVRLNRLEGAYRLGPGDQVQIDILNLPDLSRPQQVLPEGTVIFPVAGAIQLQGLTLTEAADEIAFRLSVFLNDPIVSVSLLRARPVQIAVVGEVRRPGVYVVGEDSIGAELPSTAIPTVTSMLQQAGGINEAADIRQIQVRRPDPRSQTQQKITINLWDLLQSGNLQQNIRLFDGDSIYVPQAAAIPAEEISDLTAANFSPSTIRVNVVGEVERPGQFEVPPNTTLNQALLAAGGLTSRADAGAVDLIRLQPNGTVSVDTIAIDFRQSVSDQFNPTLRNTDAIVVSSSSIAQVTDQISVFLQPLVESSIILNLFR